MLHQNINIKSWISKCQDFTRRSFRQPSASFVTSSVFLEPGFSIATSSVQIRSYFWSAFFCIRTEYGDLLRKSVFSPNIGKYGPEITPYLDTFHAVYDSCFVQQNAARMPTNLRSELYFFVIGDNNNVLQENVVACSNNSS